MFLYHVECETSRGRDAAIVLAADDEGAFAAAEVLLLRHYVAMPEVRSMAIVEKKPVAKGSGYLVETR